MPIEELSQLYRSRSFGFYYCDSKADALALVKALIPKGSTTSIGGSVTLQQCGIQNWLETWFMGKYLDRYAQKGDEVFKAALTCDTYLTSCNALTRSGSLHFMDRTGNRVAAIAYGPKQVLVVSGINKLVDDDAAALQRIKTIAAPLNAKRLNVACPCVKGCCQYDPNCLCQKYLKIEQGMNRRIKVILINESLGY